MKRLIFIFVICYTFADLKNEGCRALCQRDGYDSGQYRNRECVCYESKGKYEDFKHRRVKIPKGWNDEPTLTVIVPSTRDFTD